MQTASDYVSARVERDLAESFRLAAELDRVSLSQALRTAMRDYVQRVAGNERRRAPTTRENAPKPGSKRPTSRRPTRKA
jgi:hypothetical protein